MSRGIGLRIKNKRIEIGISQEDLAARMGLKSKSTICKIERGEDNLTSDSLNKYAKALGVTVDYLVGNEDSSGNKTVNKLLLELQDEEKSQANEFLNLYQDADPEIQSAVLTLLKSAKRDS